MSGFGRDWRNYRPARTAGGTLGPRDQAGPEKPQPRVRGARRCVLTDDDQIIDAADAKERGIGGIAFMSRREAKHFIPLRRREKSGEIRNLLRQHAAKVVLYAIRPDGMKEAITSYLPDYRYDELVDGAWVPRIADAKGHRTDTYKLKKKWVEAQTGIKITEL